LSFLPLMRSAKPLIASVATVVRRRPGISLPRRNAAFVGLERERGRGREGGGEVILLSALDDGKPCGDLQGSLECGQLGWIARPRPDNPSTNTS
jgi:hypothetical protein